MPLQDDSRFRWYVLALAMVTYGLLAGAARLAMPVLFPVIARDLDLSPVQVGTIWGMDPLAGVFIGLPGGLLADRFGVRRTLTIVCIFSGIFGALRGLSVDFVTMSTYMFLFGVMVAITPSVLPKVTTIWFEGKQLATANGMLTVAWSLGAVAATLSSATVLEPFLGGWRNVFYFFGAPSFLLGLMWWFTGRSPRKPLGGAGPGPVEAVPFRTALSHVLRIKTVWILGLTLLSYWGANMGFSGYLALYLQDYQGWTPVAASGAVTVFIGIGILGVMPMVWYSNKIGSRKIVIGIAAVVVGSAMASVPFVTGNAVWVLVVAGGLLRAGAPALANVMLFEMEGVGARYAGTAIGLTNTLGMLGAFLSPPIGNSLSAVSDSAPMLLWGSFALATIPLLFFIKERKIHTGNPH